LKLGLNPDLFFKEFNPNQDHVYVQKHLVHVKYDKNGNPVDFTRVPSNAKFITRKAASEEYLSFVRRIRDKNDTSFKELNEKYRIQKLNRFYKVKTNLLRTKSRKDKSFEDLDT